LTTGDLAAVAAKAAEWQTRQRSDHSSRTAAAPGGSLSQPRQQWQTADSSRFGGTQQQLAEMLPPLLPLLPLRRLLVRLLLPRVVRVVSPRLAKDCTLFCGVR